VTVHDLAFLREPSHFTARGNRYFRRALDVVRTEAAHVIVPSDATRVDCLAHGFDEERLSVVPHAARSVPVSSAVVAQWRSQYGIERPYVLWCGTLEPRKNVVRLVEAFSRARASGEIDADLVLVGPSGWLGTADEVRSALAALDPGSVHLLGWLSDADLQAAYAGAAAFAFPSLWEGFGMPVLEAMSHGVPVVTSAGTSMAEIVGTQGRLVDPLDVDDMAAGIVAALGTVDRVAVRERAASFTWAASAAAHVAIYRAVATAR
jgi:glycosyltransferase involved in cell wall biosynthesis